MRPAVGLLLFYKEKNEENENMKNYKIAVAGTGYVGLSLSVLLAQHNQVMAVDIVQAKVDMINNHKSPIQDDYIEKYLAEKELNLTATLDNHFEDMEWHIRLVLEGEDRLVRNLEARESETFSYAADVNPEYNNEMEDPRINVMDFVLNKEFLRKASELLKKHQWEMICRHYIEGMTHREIAAEMGVSHQYVTKGIKKGLHRIRCTYT